MGIFKAYDVRGIYGKDLTEKDAYMIGFYFAKNAKDCKIKVAHDMRLSYEQLTKFFMQGTIDAGSEIIYLGKSSTPNFYFSLNDENNTGVMITASHNPGEYNGFKFILKGNSFDEKNGMMEMKNNIEKDVFNKAGDFDFIYDSVKSMSLNELLSENEIVINSTCDEYSKYLFNFYNMHLKENERNVLESIKFGVDFSSGVSSVALIDFLEMVRLNYVAYNKFPDGRFPNHSPNPLIAGDYLKTNGDKSTAFTAVFDGDGDRIVFYDENFNIIIGDYVINKFIDEFSKKNNSYVVDLRVSRSIREMAEEKNLNIKLLRVGRAFYKEYMDKHSCLFGAELSGHYFFRDFHNFDNPDIALIYMLKFVAKELINIDELIFSSLFSEYKKYYKLPEINIEVKSAEMAISKLKDLYKDNIEMEIDGISFKFDEYWFNIRKSNTEPLVRINLEAKSKNVADIKIKDLIEKLIS